VSPADGTSGPARRLWSAETRSFDGALLREAIVLRGWAGVGDFATSNGLRQSTVYAAVAGHIVRDRTALRILQALGKRDPIVPP
jgi:hypothetical protein